LKEITPVRLLKNAFFEQVESAYANGATLEELKTLLGRGRAKKGMFEGDLESGELEIGQISARLDRIETASDIVSQMIEEYRTIAGDNPFFGF
jgi:enoyl-[acyl-carrier protein] reductase II